MTFAERVEFALDAGPFVSGRIEEKWDPGECKNEKDYEKSLQSFLQAELYGIPITRQFGHGQMRADLAVGEKLLLELKHNFDSTSELQRSIGQLEILRTLGKTVIVVLAGRTDPNFAKQLEEHIEDMNCRGFNPMAPFGAFLQFLLVVKHTRPTPLSVADPALLRP